MAPVTRRDSSKRRKLKRLLSVVRCEPLKNKTRMVAERKLMDKMSATGKPYLAPIEHSKEIENKVRREKEET